MTDTELTALLDSRNTQLIKVAKEQSDRFDAVEAARAALQAIIDAGGTITPALVAAAERLGTTLDTLDAAIPDAPAPTT